MSHGCVESLVFPAIRRASCSFVREKLQHDLRERLVASGIKEDKFTVTVNITPITTTDPEIIEIAYHSAFQDNDYIRPKVIIDGERTVDERTGAPPRPS